VPTVPSIATAEVSYYGFIYMRSVQKLQHINSKTKLIYESTRSYTGAKVQFLRISAQFWLQMPVEVSTRKSILTLHTENFRKYMT